LTSLVGLKVTGLLGQFDHTIEFPEYWDFIILHGPNGVGKTKLLELIEAVSNGASYLLRQLPFESASLYFSDGKTLSVFRTGQIALQGVGADEFEEVSGSINFRLSRPGEKDRTWTPGSEVPELTPRLLRAIERELPLVRYGARRWRDSRTNESFGLPELLHAFPQILRYVDAEVGDADNVIGSLFADFNVHLIETQRLLRVQLEGVDERRGIKEVPLQRSTVLEYANDMARRLAIALAQNSRRSQELDRSFPRRLLAPDVLSDEITDDMIRQRYADQSTLRSRLAELAVLDPAQEIPLPKRQLKEWERLVLWTYLEDSESKLETFSDLLERVTLLKDIVNSRLLQKEMVIDQNRGFVFRTSADRLIRGDQLSSGEQHELVLMYDLLFNVSPGSLVLIDEPEISLHVGWQQEFLNDIARIAKLTSCRFIVATHSPQVINKWWDRARALHPESIAEGQLA